MLKVQVAVGRAYVNEKAGLIREVIQELDQRHVRFNTFDLATGQLIAERRQTCRKSQLVLWADREANARELQRMHPYAPAASAPEPTTSAGSEFDQFRSRIDGAPAQYTLARIKG